jgi:hypothetical protein
VRAHIVHHILHTAQHNRIEDTTQLVHRYIA